MSELFINKAKTCAVTGHRKVSKDIKKENVINALKTAILDGYDTFLVGMALGFDTVCFQVLEDLRKDYKIRIIACVPCITQSYKFSLEQKEEYDRMIKSSDEVVLVSENYTKYCMKKRNDYMVNNSSRLICYLRQNFGGTFYTVNKAKKENLKIIEI